MTGGGRRGGRSRGITYRCGHSGLPWPAPWSASRCRPAHHNSIPPSTRATSSWPDEDVRMRGVEVAEKARIQDGGARNPGAVLRAIPLPLHEVLHPSPSPSYSQDTGNSVGWPSIDDPGSRVSWNIYTYATFLNTYSQVLYISGQ